MTLYERLLPQARERLNQQKDRWPNVIAGIEEKLNDDYYYSWTELPYSTVRMLHDRIFDGDYTEPIEEEEMRMLFEDYWRDEQ